ncbi:hypothetical protein EDC14_102613 [Hydrogenispora ethanolica]|uniref:Spermatogenesis-associated protein 20-like TRX domain-containing protein n=1 Tax=Hydrogenispora ethanolica TaxID=1082276 RepID=A0A4R1R9L7_HYDET|nr:thioredoxin domain-containing protein [Hydrogenispora ethanolica]TCL62270.1 hypothetical protein EDC14_102613 [Hydrogenispora ethanolica]
MPEPQPTNRLIHETSPYLLQHAHNPVDWYPWGDEAFQKAKQEDKPILLSCGYSACHWCHVMEHESFEDPDIAALMNQYFVNIKVDREERPDIDQLYQDAVHTMGVQGGWPLTVFLDHELRPFYGGTYFPPHASYGRPGFPEVLEALHERWINQRDKIHAASAELADFMTQAAEAGPETAELPGPEFAEEAVRRLSQYFDARNGGFDGAPKFPNPSLLQLFLKVSVARKPARQPEHFLFTLEKMARGGIYDQLGGGFHRYATDSRWLVPHFEKMLYDNAQLLSSYAAGYQLNGSAEFRQVIRETAAYVRRKMTAPEGGFYATQDADSEGEEGRYYLWTPREIRAALEPDAAQLVIDYYRVSEAGNFEGRYILNRLNPPLAALSDHPDGELQERLAAARAKLLAVREQRIKPFRDEKIITSWNGLMIGGLAQAYQVLGDAADYETARRAANFLLDRMKLNDGGLARIYKDGAARIAGFLDDYSFLAQGLLQLYECDFDPRWLRAGLELTETASGRFGDGSGRYYLTAAAGQLLKRPVSGSDQAIPSGVAVQAENLLKLAAYIGNEPYREEAARILGAYGPAMTDNPWGYAGLIGALDAWHRNYQTFTFVTDQAGVPDLLRRLQGEYLPYRVLLLCQAGTDLAHHPAAPLLAGHRPLEGKPTCYACMERSCHPPVTGWEELRALLNPEAPQ